MKKEELRRKTNTEESNIWMNDGVIVMAFPTKQNKQLNKNKQNQQISI